MKKVIVSLLLLSAPMALAQDPKGLPDAPEWVADPENPNRPKPPAAQDAPETYGSPAPAADPSDLRAQVAKSAEAAPADRFAEALKPQVRRVKPGGFSAAASSANSGDTLLLAAGRYRECASIRASNITLRAEKPGAAIFDGVTCEGKAILVLKGNRVLVDGLVFRNASVRDRNGAGIRSEGQGLVVKRSTFQNNENGILSSIGGTGTLLIEDSVFDGNGTCEGAGGCAHGIYINQVTQLIVRRSTFINTHIAHHIKSRAKSTLVEDCVIDDHSGGNSSYLIELPNGGTLVARNNLLIKGPRTDNTTAFIAYGLENLKQGSVAPVIERNRFINRLPMATYLVVTSPAGPTPKFKGNTQSGKITGAHVVYRG